MQDNNTGLESTASIVPRVLTTLVEGWKRVPPETETPEETEMRLNSISKMSKIIPLLALKGQLVEIKRNKERIKEDQERIQKEEGEFMEKKRKIDSFKLDANLSELSYRALAERAARLSRLRAELIDEEAHPNLLRRIGLMIKETIKALEIKQK